MPPLLRETVNCELGFTGSDSHGVRCAAAWACGRMGGKEAAVHLDLLISLLHTDARVNPDIPETLGIIGPVNDNVVKNLVDAFENTARPVDWPEFKLATLRALERCGPKAAPAVAFLARNLEKNFTSSHHYHQARYLPVIMRIFAAVGPGAREAAPVIKKYVELKEFRDWKPDELAEIRKAAAAALEEVSAPPKPASPADSGTPAEPGKTEGSKQAGEGRS
jgi:HEAT repeat protein